MSTIHIHRSLVNLDTANSFSLGYSLDDRLSGVIDVHYHAFAHALIGATAMADHGNKVRIRRITRPYDTTNRRSTNIKANICWGGGAFAHT
jgi:2C-methyl-D-erythritol 2,4-cyclodiphosphate synthase